ncbi:unnamed protein product [Ixodes pacificus]
MYRWRQSFLRGKNKQEKSAPVHRMLQFPPNVHLDGRLYLVKCQAVFIFLYIMKPTNLSKSTEDAFADDRVSDESYMWRHLLIGTASRRHTLLSARCTNRVPFLFVA